MDNCRMRWTVGSMYMVQDSSDESLIPVFIIWRMRVQASQVLEEYRIVYNNEFNRRVLNNLGKFRHNTDWQGE